MWDFSLFRALGLLIRTWPFVVYRAAIALGIALALVAATAAGAVAGRALAGISGEAAGQTGALWGGLGGCLLLAGTAVLLRGRLLHLVMVPHLAALVEAIDRRPLPYGPAQVAAARALVAGRFGDPAALAALDRLVRAVIGSATGLVAGLLVDLLPLGVLDRLLRATGTHRRLAIGAIEAVVLAHAIRTRSENAWEAAHDGLVLYTQNARPMLAHAIWLALIGWALTAAVALAVWPTVAPLAGAVPLMPGQDYLLAALVGWGVKAALLDPIAVACMLQLHLRLTEDQTPLAEWRGRLTQVSSKFRQLGEQALGWRTGAAPDL